MPRSWLPHLGDECVETAWYGDRQRSDGISVVHAITVRYALGEPDERTSTGLPLLLTAEAADRPAQNIERLIRAVMDVPRGRETRRMQKLHHGQRATCSGRRGLDGGQGAEEPVIVRR